MTSSGGDDQLTLYRGIAVPSKRAEEVMATIASSGLRGDEGNWRFTVPDVAAVRGEIDDLFRNPSLTSNDIFRETPFLGVCACGTAGSAHYYAASHNASVLNDQPLCIEFDTSLDVIYVDPRDFLCTAFQSWDAVSGDRLESQSDLLARLFGQQIIRYFAAASRTKKPDQRIAMCNLAAFDPEVVRAHYANQTVIGGRYGVLMSSAFFVQAPIRPEQIRDVRRVHSYNAPATEVTLDTFRSGGPRDDGHDLGFE